MDIREKYRKDYSGEDVNLVGLYVNGEWRYQSEFVPSSVTDVPYSDRAVVVGNGISRSQFDLALFLDSRTQTTWGEYTEWVPAKQRKKFNTYGCNALYRDFRVDFLVSTGDSITQEIAESEYADTNVVYAAKTNLEKYSSKFHYIPQDPPYNSGAIAAYMAAFDGHKRVFLLGFDGIDSSNETYNVYANTNGYPDKNSNVSEDFWVQSMSIVFSTYKDVEFIRVCPTSGFRTPEQWKYFLNFRTIDFRQFAVEADL